MTQEIRLERQIAQLQADLEFLRSENRAEIQRKMHGLRMNYGIEVKSPAKDGDTTACKYIIATMLSGAGLRQETIADILCRHRTTISMMLRKARDYEATGDAKYAHWKQIIEKL